MLFGHPLEALWGDCVSFHPEIPQVGRYRVHHPPRPPQYIALRASFLHAGGNHSRGSICVPCLCSPRSSGCAWGHGMVGGDTRVLFVPTAHHPPRLETGRAPPLMNGEGGKQPTNERGGVVTWAGAGAWPRRFS